MIPYRRRLGKCVALGVVPILAWLAGGCAHVPDYPAQTAQFPVMYGSMTDKSNTSKIEEEKQAKVRLDDIMLYLGIIPAFDDTHPVTCVPPPTVFNPTCTSFLDPRDPDNQNLCGRSNMISDYIDLVRSNNRLPADERLILLVSPFRKYVNEDMGFTPYLLSKTCVLFDDQITALAGYGDLRWRGIAIVGMHELGHVLGVDDLELDPLDHNAHYAHGCIMRQIITNDHSWPGNIRELENIVRRAVFKGRSEEIRLEDLPFDFVQQTAATRIRARRVTEYCALRSISPMGLTTDARHTEMGRLRCVYCGVVPSGGAGRRVRRRRSGSAIRI